MATHKEALTAAVRAYYSNGGTMEADIEAALRAYLDAMDAVIVLREPIGYIAEGIPKLLARGIQGSVFISTEGGDGEIPIFAAAPNPFKDEDNDR